MQVPDEFIAWAVRNAESNVALANLSNVNRHWRRIVIQVLLEQAQNDDEEDDDSHLLLLLPSMLRNIVRNENTITNAPRESFCAAWFHPSGIQIHQPQNDNDEVWDHDNHNNEGNRFSPSGSILYELSDDDWPRPRHAPRGRSLLRRSQQHAHQQQEGPLCSHEWQGYRDVIDVLEPFGYAHHFVETILSLAREQSTHENGVARYAEAETARQRNARATLAVRGATLARPEGYCLCWDNSNVASTDTTNQRDGCLRSIMARKQRRQLLQLEVLPRVLLSSKHKNSLNPEQKSKQQPCLQFLNAAGSNAVRLFTPPFACGPLQGPITLFLVGIATEDGCFVSGLNRRCELGHMHPVNLHDAMIDQSPVCMATDFRRPPRAGSPSESMMASRRESLSAQSSGGDSGGDDSDDSSCAVNANGQDDMKCKCEFNQAAAQSWETQDDEDTPEECIYRGQRGPGLWHCYVCVFDQENSVIRIDGAEEPLQKGRGESPPPAILDGLTIGSDHCFDMSLCLGDASIEEGEGAISEIAVFKGRMADADIEILEDYLMHKHGIAKPTAAERETLVRQDKWKRQGRALIAQPAPWSMRVANGIPLPIMARDKDVSWHRVNAVTGKDVRVSRIGSKLSNGSSDW